MIMHDVRVSEPMPRTVPIIKHFITYYSPLVNNAAAVAAAAAERERERETLCLSEIMLGDPI